ncbi:MAG: hypothetical protein ACPG49_11780 [Chitinophagales bacterium]
MKRKKKIVLQQTLILEQSPALKRMGYFLAIMGFLSVVVLIPDMKAENTQPIMFIPLLLIIWVFVILPFNAITTKKRLIIKGGKFIIESNKQKYSINTNLGSMIWWRKIRAMPGLMDISNKIQINFTNKKIMLDELEFKNFYELEYFFKTNFQEKEKRAR